MAGGGAVRAPGARRGELGKDGGIDGIRADIRQLARRVRGDAEPGHHGHYSDRVASALPHGGGLSPAKAVDLVQASPWGQARVERLRDIEWAVLEGRGLLDQLLGTSPVAITAGS